METYLHNAKRKKRKTRKCLDELRKRSRSNSVKNIYNSSSQNELKLNGPTTTSIKKINNNCITSKRLTLTMFAKAVRSETITRPLLCHGSKQDYNYELNTRYPVNSALNLLVPSKDCDVPSKLENETDVFARQSDYAQPTIPNESSSDSITWFSPIKQSNRFLESDIDDTISTEISTRSYEEFGYHLYEELLEDIPLYTKRTLSSFIKYDVMKKTKTCLQSLYLENFRQNHEDNPSHDLPTMQLTSILTSDRSYTTPTNTIVQNPMDYIKIGWGHSFHRSDSCSTPTDAGVSPLQSPLAQTQIPSIISYTPDYDFFPHRLNE